METSAHITTTALLNRLLSRGKFRHVQVLLRLAELGSVQRTADAIGMTQSSVTQTLAYLERLLDTRLFERHARGVRPTPACTDLLPVARQILLGVTEGAEAIATRQRRNQGLVRLLASVSATHGLLTDALAAFAKKHPQIEVHLGEAEGEDQLLAIARGEVDIVACRRPPVIPEGWQFVPLREDRFAVLCRARHPLARGRYRWRDLGDATWLLAPAGTAARERFDALAAQLPGPPKIHPLITRSPAMMWWLLRHEDALGFLPASFARPLIDSGEVCEVKVQPANPIQPLGLLYGKDNRSAAAALLTDFLLAQRPKS